MTRTDHEPRLARLLGVPLAPDAAWQWPQSGELVRGRERIAKVEPHLVDPRLRVAPCLTSDDVVVEWTTDHGGGRVFRNVAEQRDGGAARASDVLDMPRDGTGRRRVTE
jgi:hypothetical protein